MVSLLIADDHTLFRHGLRQLCEVNGGFMVLAEATTGEDAIMLAREYQPDVILMDIRMAGITGIEASRQILLAQPSARILMLTMYRQDHYVLNALRLRDAHPIISTMLADQSLFVPEV